MSTPKPMTPAEMGRKGGKSRSDKKVAAARKNGLIASIHKQIQKEFDKGKALR